MERDGGVSSMIMYEDESLDVRYANGSELQLSPCGSEFLLVRAADASGRHPLLGRERVRQRSRFTISTYKELVVAALAFRNKYASRPYLPEELMSADHMKCFFSLDPDVTWPDASCCEAEVGPGGETIIRSEEGRAALMLSPSGEDFSVRFTCRLSRGPSQHHGVGGFSGDADHRPGGQLHPEERYQSTTVVQHHSCSAYAPIWHYPLSLARRHWASRLSKSQEISAEGTSSSAQADRKINMSDVPAEERSSCLPEALPLTCPTPHRHRWKFKDPLTTKEQSGQDLPTELVKVMWCQGVTYRILSGAVSIIEVSPGDGSVIRSNGVLKSYFTHHRPDLQSRQVKEISYHLNSLPPDVVGELYSVCSIVSRASRILSCYDQARQSLKLPATPSCLQEPTEGRHFSKPSVLKENLSSSSPAEDHMMVTQRAENQSDLVAAELEKIKRFNFLLENSSLQKHEKGCVEMHRRSAQGEITEPVNESSIAEALLRTSRAIQDIDAVVSAASQV